MENIRTEKDCWATKTGLDYAPCETRKRKILEWVKPEQKQSQSNLELKRLSPNCVRQATAKTDPEDAGS